MKAVGKKAGLLLAAFMLPLVVAEVGLRLSGDEARTLRQRRRAPLVRPSQNPLLKYELAPGGIGPKKTGVAINAAGFRGPEPTPEPYSGYRIVILGDSIGYGIGLPETATFAHKLQHALREPGMPDRGGHGYEVLNFGVGGYDTLQEVALLEARGLAYRPELVVVAFCLNDVGVVSVNLKKLRSRAGLQPPRRSRWRLVQFAREKFEASVQRQRVEAENDAADFRREYAEQIDSLDGDAELSALMARVPDIYPSSWYHDPDRIGRLRFSFRWLAEMANAEGFDVLVATVPFLHVGAGEYPHALSHAIVAHEARRAGFDTIDLTEPFLEVGMERLRSAPRDSVHPNEQGNAIIAAELLHYIEAMQRATVSED